MAELSHPCLTALSAVLEDAAGTLHVPVEDITVELLEARDWPDTGLGLKPGGRAVTPGYLVRLGGGIVYRTDRYGCVLREPTEPTLPGEIRLRFTEEGGITGRRIFFETDSSQLSDADEAELKRLMEDANFFNVAKGEPSHNPDGITTTLWIAIDRRNHEVVRGDGSAMEDSEEFQALVAWVRERAPSPFPRSSVQLD